MRFTRLTLVLALALAPACASSPAESGEAHGDDHGVGAERAPTVRTLHSMARVLAAQGRDGQCELVLRKLIDEHPDFMPAYVELAELYLRHDRGYDAVGVLREGARHGPDDPVVHNDLGLALLLGNDPRGALEHFDRAAELVPGDARSAANRAACLGLLGRYDEALEAYLEIVPAEDAHFNLGVLAESNGDSVRAAREFRIAQALENGEDVDLAAGVD